jgi:hypothetical protein
MNKLIDAALAVVERWDSPKWAHDSTHTSELIFALREALQEDTLVCLTNTHQQLDAALTEKSEEYELIGQIFGTYGGRWVFIPENKYMAWPEGTAVYVKRVKK